MGIAGGFYLSDVLDTSKLQPHTLNIIQAPCGCGKTTAAINKLLPLASHPHRALYLIDTTVGKDRLAREDALTLPYALYTETAGSTSQNFLTEPQDNKVVVTTYAQFGAWARSDPNLPSKFDIIVCDEIHNLINFSNIPSPMNFTLFARYALETAIAYTETYIVGITATPSKLDKFNCAKNIILLDDGSLNRFTNLYVAPTSSLPEGFPSGRGIIYYPRITQMLAAAQQATTYGRKPICIWSMSNATHPLSEEQLAARQYIIEREELPPQYDILLINASCETSINIRGDIQWFVVNSRNIDTIEQARGRFRGDLNVLYVPSPEVTLGTIQQATRPGLPDFSSSNSGLRTAIPEEFVGKYLNSEQKGRLLQWIRKEERKNINSDGDLIAFMEKKGYNVNKARSKGLVYIIIKPMEK